VLFGKWSGTEVKIDDQEYLIMKESDIMGVLVETEARRKLPDNASQLSDRRFVSLKNEHKRFLLRSYRHVCQRKLNSQSTHATGCCAESTLSPTRSE
jgi:hypothetical protein